MPRQSESEQTRNSMLPVPAKEGLLNVAPSSALRAHAPSAGASSSTAGANVSSWRLRVALHEDWLPAASRPRACQ
jgi:hypothetical protein